MGYSEKILDQRKTKIQRGRFQILALHVGESLNDPTLSSFLAVTHFSPLGLLGALTAVALAGVSRLRPSASPDLQHNSGFTFTDSCDGLSGSQCRDSPATDMAWVALLNFRGRVHNPFILRASEASTHRRH